MERRMAPLPGLRARRMRSSIPSGMRLLLLSIAWGCGAPSPPAAPAEPIAAGESRAAPGPPGVPLLGGHLRIPDVGPVAGDARHAEVILEPGPDPLGAADFVLRATE